jgi:hypothetical protein
VEIVLLSRGDGDFKGFGWTTKKKKKKKKKKTTHWSGVWVFSSHKV